jgi:hypothetical protein
LVPNPIRPVQKLIRLVVSTDLGIKRNPRCSSHKNLRLMFGKLMNPKVVTSIKLKI